MTFAKVVADQLLTLSFLPLCNIKYTHLIMSDKTQMCDTLSLLGQVCQVYNSGNYKYLSHYTSISDTAPEVVLLC